MEDLGDGKVDWGAAYLWRKVAANELIKYEGTSFHRTLQAVLSGLDEVSQAIDDNH